MVAEWGGELQGKTVTPARPCVAHPDFREELLEAAARTSGGRLAFPSEVI